MTNVITLERFKTALARFYAALPGVFPQRKTITVTLPTDVTTYVVSNAWITADADCYCHDLGTTAIATTVSWAFDDGTVTFTLGEALSDAVTFHFGMIRGGI